MTWKRFWLAAIIALCAPVSEVRADGYLDEWHPHQSYWSVGWEIGVPVDSLRSNWVGAVSPAGGQFEVRVGLMEHLSVGVALNYNWFSQTFPQTTVQLPDYTFTGSVYRRFSAFTA